MDSEFEFALTRTARTVFQALLSGQIMSHERLIFAVYADRIDDSPLDARGVIDVTICHLRKALKPHAVRIETKYGTGFRISPDTLAKARALVRETTLPMAVCPHCGVARVDA